MSFLQSVDRKSVKFCSLLLLALFIFTASCAEAANHDLTESGSITLSGTEDYVITGTYNGTSSGIIVSDDYTGILTLNSVDITSSAESALRLKENADVHILLKGTNILQSGRRFAGLAVPAGARISLDDSGDGNGTLVAKAAYEQVNGGGAGIGGDGGYDTDVAGGDCGTVIIMGGTITATGGSAENGGGAGIGGGGALLSNAGNGGTVVIQCGMLTATGGSSWSQGGGAGIGGGGVRRAAVDTKGGDGAAVTISGGVVVAAKGTGDGNGFMTAAQDIGRGAYLHGVPAIIGTTTITGGSINATTVEAPTNSLDNAVLNTGPTDYTGSAGKTISFNVADTMDYQYTFTVPSDGNAYLWLPAADTPRPDSDDVYNLTTPTLTLTSKYESGKSVVDLSVFPGTLAGWARLNPRATTWALGTSSTDDNQTAGFSTAGVYSYSAKTGNNDLSIWSARELTSLTAPQITNADTTLSVQQGTSGTLTVVTIAGTPAPAFSATLQGGNALPTWITIDASSGKITATPSASQTTGNTTITVTATNGIGTASAKDFTVAVSEADEEDTCSSGSGGCNAGAGFFAILALGMAVKRKR